MVEKSFLLEGKVTADFFLKESAISLSAKIRGRDLVLATKASVLLFLLKSARKPAGSRYTYVAPGDRASRCACNFLLVQKKYHGTLFTTAKQTVFSCS